jgi:RimJ/RimL family protein N-acetyltransferase
VTDERRKGYALQLIAQILRSPELAGSTVTWLASATNEPSIKLAKKLGFDEYATFGYLEMGKE